MIENMKKVFILCLAQDKDQTVDRLAELGTLHVEELKPPQSEELDTYESELDNAERACDILGNITDKKKAAEEEQAPTDYDARGVVEQVLQFRSEIESQEENAERLRGIRQEVEPWGSFSKELLTNAREKGIDIRLCSSSPNQMPSLPEEAVKQEILREKDKVHFVVIAPQGSLPEDLPEVSLHEETQIEEIDKKIQEAEQKVQDLWEELKGFLLYLPLVEERVQELTGTVDILSARDGMEETETISYLKGYIPEANLESLHEAARNNGWGVKAEDPPDDDPNVPTKLTIPKWARPIRLVLDGMGLVPGYREVDISPWFFAFLAVFVGFIFGDAGYGILMLVGVLAARAKYRDVAVEPFMLVGIFACTTIIWGVLTGTYFGISENLWGPLDRVKFLDVMENRGTIQKICFFVGTIHLTVAHAWNMIVHGRSVKTIQQVGWIFLLWSNLFLANTLVIGDPFPSMVLYAGYIPGLAIVVLTTIIAEFGFVNLFLMVFDIINSFVDIISYIRLYAVGVATFAVAHRFNVMVEPMLPDAVTFLAGAVILLLGHGLNVILAGLSVIVHGVRLNVLEFSQHKNMEWSGVWYKPLKKVAKEESG